MNIKYKKTTTVTHSLTLINVKDGAELDKIVHETFQILKAVPVILAHNKGCSTLVVRGSRSKLMKLDKVLAIFFKLPGYKSLI